MLRLQKYALFVMIFLLPFNGLRELIDIGELSRDGFFFGSVLYLATTSLCVATRSIRIDALRLPKVHVVYALLILTSLVLSATIISENSYGDRTGVEKYVVSSFTFFYYMALSLALYLHATTIGIERFANLMSKAFVVVGAFLVAVCVVELLSWYVPSLRSLMRDFRALFAESPVRTAYRLSGVSLEPSFNAFALLACVPWVVYRGAVSSHLAYRLLAIALLVLCVVSGARTAYVGLAFMGLALLLARGPRLLPRGWDGAAMVMAAFTLGVVVPLVAFTYIGAESTTSDVTRGHLTMQAVRAGVATLWGQGFGQTAFFVVKRASSVLPYSWELMEYYQGERYGELPPLFSWYARTIGEFGAVGYAVLAVSFALAARRVFRLGRTAIDPFGKRLFLVAALLIAQMLAIAFSIDSVRVPQFWLAWLLGGLLVAHVRSQHETRSKAVASTMQQNHA